MRIAKRMGQAMLGLLLPVGLGFGYTARAPYAVPDDARPGVPAELVQTAPRRPGGHSVVVFVFDGFAPATLHAADAPNLARMAAEGAHALDMMPVFPSLSMPNHFSLATGCYPEHHGVVSNHFRDPERGIYHDRGDADWLVGCEPMHVVAERQGVRAAVFANVAAVSSRRGKLASVAEPYVSPPRDAVAQADRIIAQLERPADERPGLITAYVNEPDATSHVAGPTAPSTLLVAHQLDVQIGRVIGAIERLGLRDQVTLIVTTDHGMIEVDKIVSVERVLRAAGIDALVLADGALAHVYLQDRSEKRAALRAITGEPALEAIDPLAPPKVVHVGRSPRVGDLMASTRRGYYTFDSGFWPAYLRFATFIGPAVSPSKRFHGMHGHDPEAVPEVRAIFFAWGRDVRPGSTLAGMRSVDVHPTVAHLLGIEPGKPVDGQARTDFLVSSSLAVEAPAQAL